MVVVVVVVVVVSSRNRLNRLTAQPIPAQPIPAFNPSCFNFCLIGLLRILLCNLRLLRILPVAHPARFLLFPPEFIHLISVALQFVFLQAFPPASLQDISLASRDLSLRTTGGDVVSQPTCQKCPNRIHPMSQT